MAKLLHIASKDAWLEAKSRGSYVTNSLDEEGFIHCSTREQVIEVANHLFHGRKDLLLLVINEDIIGSPVRYEDPGNGKYYPHIYGPLNLSAVEKVVEFKPNTDGRFTLPDVE